MDLIRRVTAGAVRKSEKDGKTLYHFVASDETYDRYRTVLLAGGWDTAAYRKNPVIFWGHESWKPPIGAAGELSINADKLGVGVEFADTEFANEIKKLVDGKFLRAVSVGFKNLERRPPTPEERAKFGIPDDHQNAEILARNELYEISIVGVPGNPNALISKLSADEALAEEMLSRGISKLREKAEGRTNEDSEEAAMREAMKCPSCKGGGKCPCGNCDEEESAKKLSAALTPALAATEKRLVEIIKAELAAGIDRAAGLGKKKQQDASYVDALLKQAEETSKTFTRG